MITGRVPVLIAEREVVRDLQQYFPGKAGLLAASAADGEPLTLAAPGVGLGLALSHSRVEKMRGILELGSAAGTGSTFNYPPAGGRL